MYNVLMILSHRPFVADGHLYGTSRAKIVDSFMSCATTADDIVQLLRAYDKAFSVRGAPYLISHAAYVAATIHASIAAKRGPGSQAQYNLETCLVVFRENQETNWNVRRAYATVQNLMKELGVASPSLDEIQIDRDVTGSSHTRTPDLTSSRTIGHEPSLHRRDMDGILQILGREREQETPHPVHMGSTGRHNSSKSTAPLPPPWSSTSTDIPGTASVTGHTETIVPYDSNGSSVYQEQQQLFGWDSLNVDDTIYGFNGSAFDNFPLPNWDRE
jgi:hypothetical protein